MKCAYIFSLILIFNYLLYPVVGTFGFDYAILAGIGSIGAVLYQNFDRYIGCSLGECCPAKTGRKDWIPVNIRGLNDALNTRLHGQHLVQNVVSRAVQAHYSNDEPSKALVLSFHGWTGGGKNYVARMIADNVYKNGMKSKFVHFFVSTVHFPHEDLVDIYKLNIQDWIRGNVSICEQSMFIFDEIDKMPVGVIDAIKPFIDYHESISGIDYRKSVFIFLSNTGSRDIIKKVLQNWKAGGERRDIKYGDMEELVLKGAFNEIGGLHESNVIQHSLIDYYVPFLPLERRHIELCIKDELLRRKLKPSPEFTKKILDGMMFFPPENQLYSTKGCKSVGVKVGYLLTEEHFHDVFS